MIFCESLFVILTVISLFFATKGGRAAWYVGKDLAAYAASKESTAEPVNFNFPLYASKGMGAGSFMYLDFNKKYINKSFMLSHRTLARFTCKLLSIQKLFAQLPQETFQMTSH